MTPLLGWLGFLGLALTGLVGLEMPETHAVSVAFDGVRLVAIALDLYLMVTSVLGLLLRLARAGAAVRLLDGATLPFVRRVLNGAAGMVLAVSVATPGGAVAAERPADPPPVMRLLEEAPPPPPVPGPAAPGAPAVHEVRPGENCWSIAATVLEARLGRPPRDAEVVPYWRSLVAANAGRFRTGDPDLVFSGQELLLP